MIKLLDLLNEMDCWDGYKQGNPKTKISSKTGKRVNNCVPVEEGLKNTSWTNKKNQTITLQQLLDAIKDYPVVQTPIKKIKKIIIGKDTGGIESDRLSAADVKYPIIIVTDDSGNYKYILDGNHRANKAIDAGLESIPAKLVNIVDLPQEFQDVLGAAERASTSHKKVTSNKQFVPNIKKAKVHHLNENIIETENFCPQCLAEYIREHINVLSEAEYHGRKVALGKPMQGDIKKFKVYVKDPKTGRIVKVNFGAHGMNIKRNNPKHRNAYRKRHHCENPGPRTKANYWSCRKW